MNKHAKSDKDSLKMRNAKADEDQQRGAPSSSRRHTTKHQKDDSDGARENTAKRQENSV